MSDLTPEQLEFYSRFHDTLFNHTWLKKNENAIKALMPETWTNIQNIDPIPLCFKLKVLGVDWRSENDFGSIMAFFVKLGFYLRDNGFLFKRNPNTVMSD